MSIKVLVASLVGVFVLFGFLYFKADSRDIKNKPTGKSLYELKIVAFGDSLVYGTGSSGGGFVKEVSDDLGVTIVNLGVPGETTQSALQRLDEIKRESPDITIIALGGNDFLRRLGPASEVKKRLGRIVDFAQSLGSAVILLEEPGYRSIYKDLSKNTGSYYVPNILDGLMGNPKLMYDRIHPNDKGYKIIAEKVRKAILDLLNN